MQEPVPDLIQTLGRLAFQVFMKERLVRIEFKLHEPSTSYKSKLYNIFGHRLVALRRLHDRNLDLVQIMASLFGLLTKNCSNTGFITHVFNGLSAKGITRLFQVVQKSEEYLVRIIYRTTAKQDRSGVRENLHGVVTELGLGFQMKLPEGFVGSLQERSW